MLILKLGKWCHKAGYLFCYDRIYTNTGKWTPLCLMRFRHVGEQPL